MDASLSCFCALNKPLSPTNPQHTDNVVGVFFFSTQIALGPDNDGTALSISFQIPTAQIGTTKVAMRADSVEYTPEFAAVYNKLPMWIGPSGKVNTPAPSSIFHSINV